MIIGLDFDNTIVSYERVFHEAALMKGLIDDGVSRTKLAVRENLRSRGMEDAWTELQGFVYGKCMHQAEIFPGVIDCLRQLQVRGDELVIISHKTRTPFAGPQYDLHEAARQWIIENLCDAKGPLVPFERINFRETKTEKVRLIADLKCDVYIDDLPEILLHPEFPENTRRYLFDPSCAHEQIVGLVNVGQWQHFYAELVD